MADSTLKLPGKFEKGKNYLVSGETMLAWKSALIADRLLPGLGLRENPTPTGRILSVQFPDIELLPLTPYAKLEGEESRLFLTPGLSEDLIPTIDAVGLTADPAPYLVISDSTNLWLSVEWEPVAEMDGGNYYISGGGTLISSEFVESTSRPTETEAAIDETTGAATNGIYVFRWAEIVVTPVGDPPVGIITIPAHRSGNHQFTFCPGSLKLLFD